MRLFRIIVAVLSVGLFAYVLSFSDPTTVFREVVAAGIGGIGAVFSIHLLVFAIDSFTWHLTMTPLPFTVPWLYRSWKVRMVGEACNMVLPAGGMGGEPIKAVLMKGYGLDYPASIASLILAKTINLIALVFFLGIGFGLILLQPTLSTSLTTPAGVGLGAFATAIFGFFVVQRWRIASRVGEWLSCRRIGYRIRAVLHHIEDIDGRLMIFYTRWYARFIWAVILAMGGWNLCALETYYAARFLGLSIDFADAWIIETMVQIVRVGSFFIPASIGVQEGIFLLAFTALGVPASGAMAVALLKRGREIAWIVWGGMLAWYQSSTPWQETSTRAESRGQT